ncbi:serine--tRNA ligase [Patescibacteria group bacterium]|nr:serine--tRNA ligase [Patescibacteria group bacterium]
MLDINFIKENPEKVKEGTKKKGYDPKIIDRVLKVDETRRQLIAEVEKWRQARNKQACFSQAQNKLKKGETKKGKKIKEMLRRLEPDLRAVGEQFENLLVEIPNLPADDVPKGRDESENVEMKKWGKSKKLSFKPKDYQQLGELLDVIDTKTASKVSGTRFGYLKNEAVQLEFALVQLALEVLIKEGFIPVVSPIMIKDEMMKGMGYLEHGGEDQAYHLDKDKLYLVGTAEQSVGPMHAGEIFGSKDLPRRYVGFSTCLRREAGTYGKDTKGIFRVHQFDKLEMFSFIKPQPKADKKEHDYLLSLEEKLVRKLEIPYQVTKMCTGDLGHPTARKYDLNCWFPAEKRYRETHSASTTTGYQARRLNIRYREGNKTDFVHTLNGTAFAIGRMILAILENYQQKDGSVSVPKVLQKYTGIKKISPKK